MKKIQLMLITANPDVALYAEESGVDRMFVDMETLGKQDRQKNQNLPQNQHTFADVERLKKHLKKAEVMIRINPPHANTAEEVEKAIDAGADCIMLPYFTSAPEIESFLGFVNGRTKTNLLLETATAAARANGILSLPCDEVHIGLNDLRLTFNLKFLYETLAGGMVDFLCETAAKNNLSYGFGGVGALSKGSDIPPDLIIKEHVRLGSERVILSRAFTGPYTSVEDLRANTDLAKEVRLLRECELAAHKRNTDEIEKDRKLMIQLVDKKVRSL